MKDRSKSDNQDIKDESRLDKHYKKIIFKLILAAAALLFWIWAVVNQKLIEAAPASIGVRYAEAVLTRQRIDDILDEMKSKKMNDIPQVTLWKKEKQVRITKGDLVRNLMAELITVAGDMSLICQGTLVDGGYLAQEDTEGCVIDRDTAFELFGSVDVIGGRLKLNDKEYLVRGILKPSGSRTVLIQDEGPGIDREPEYYNCMELRFEQPDEAMKLAENFVMTYGMGEASYIDGYGKQRLSQVFIRLPLWLCALWAIIALIKTMRKLKTSPILTLLGYGSVLMIVILIIKLADIRLQIPASMIPNRWSDFSFWSAKVKELLAAGSRKEHLARSYSDIIGRGRLMIVSAGVLLTMIIEGCLFKKDIFHK